MAQVMRRKRPKECGGSNLTTKSVGWLESINASLAGLDAFYNRNVFSTFCSSMFVIQDAKYTVIPPSELFQILGLHEECAQSPRSIGCKQGDR